MKAAVLRPAGRRQSEDTRNLGGFSFTTEDLAEIPSLSWDWAPVWKTRIPLEKSLLNKFSGVLPVRRHLQKVQVPLSNGQVEFKPKSAQITLKQVNR